MSGPRPILLLLPLAFLAILPAPVGANPCASPCGVVTITSNCLAVAITAEGTTTLNGVQWEFEASDTEGFRDQQSSQGNTASFQAATTRDETWRPYTVTATLKADGEVVASATRFCPGIV